MDTSKEYILMCEKAKKYIKKKPELYDWCYDKELDDVSAITIIVDNHYLGNTWHKDEVPLYRQDQLQDMVKSNNAYMLTKDFMKWMDDNQDEQWLLSMRFSMEKLWLTFVMKKLYNKEWKWGGKDWTKIR